METHFSVPNSFRVTGYLEIETDKTKRKNVQYHFYFVIYQDQAETKLEALIQLKNTLTSKREIKT